MITLASDCLLFELGTGECIPYSAEMVSAELGGGATELFDPEFVHHAPRPFSITSNTSWAGKPWPLVNSMER